MLELRKHVQERNQGAITALLKKAWTRPDFQENECAYICIALDELGLPMPGLFENFVERFPNSLYPVQVLLADAMARSGNEDGATSEARLYLRRIKRCGKLTGNSDIPGFRHAILRMSPARQTTRASRR